MKKRIIISFTALTLTLGMSASVFASDSIVSVNSVESEQGQFSTSFFSDINGLGEITETTTVYTYDEALKVLNENSMPRQKILIGKEQIQDGIDEINKYIDGMAAYYQATGIIDNQAYNKAILTKGDLVDSLADMDEQIKVLELGNEIQLMSALNTLTNAKTEYYLAKENLEIEEQGLEFTKIKNELGMVSDYNLDKAITNLENSSNSLKALEDKVVVAKQDVNSLLRLPLDEDVFIKFNIEVVPRDYDLEKLVDRAIEKSLTVEQAESAIDTARSEDGSESANYKLAELSLTEAKETVEKNVYKSYNTLNTLIDNYNTLVESREDLINDYNMAVIQYELGYITQFDLDKIVVGIATLDSKILSLEMLYEMTCFQLDNPQLF